MTSGGETKSEMYEIRYYSFNLKDVQNVKGGFGSHKCPVKMKVSTGRNTRKMKHKNLLTHYTFFFHFMRKSHEMEIPVFLFF